MSKMIYIKVTNQELDALEDLLFSVNSNIEIEKLKEILKPLWKEMCGAYDEK